MKIDRVYVICNKKDFYLAKICIASIRYWNKGIPVCLIKDESNDAFDTSELEEKLSVTVAKTKFKKTGYYSKLHPFFDTDINERILLLDADIVWLCDIIALLESYNEDIIIEGYSPENVKEEMSRWYFTEPGFSQYYHGYKYPGFLFNVGHILCNADVFKKEDFNGILNWQEHPTPVIKDIFFYEQGILNYILADKISKGEASYRVLHFQLWGWNKVIKALKVSSLKDKNSSPFLIHWHGIKKGIISYLPGRNLLFFYEDYYFSLINNGRLKCMAERLKRTLQHFPAYTYETGKSIYYFLKPGKSES